MGLLPRTPTLRLKFAHCVFGLCLLGPGCDLAGTAAHNVIAEFHQAAEDHHEHARNRRIARQAWDEFCGAHGGQPFSDDYADGFQQGFADYLYAGGNGEPPPLPPRQYWKARYQTPEGYQAMEDWFAGFRSGAAAAQQSGYRQYVTLPSSLAGPPPGPLVPGSAPEVQPVQEVAPPPDKREPVLPDPKPVTRAPKAAAPADPVVDRSRPKAKVLRVTALGLALPKTRPHATVLGVTAAVPAVERVPTARVLRLVAGPPQLMPPEGN